MPFVVVLKEGGNDGRSWVEGRHFLKIFVNVYKFSIRVDLMMYFCIFC